MIGRDLIRSLPARRTSKGAAASLLFLFLLVTAGRAEAITEAQAFKAVRHANLRPTRLWPAYIPKKITTADWSIETIRGKGPYGRTPLSAPNGFELYYSYPFKGEFGGGGFARTNQQGLNRLLRVATEDGEPPSYMTLGGRTVIKFRPGTTSTSWAFSGPGGIYVLRSNDFGGPSQSVIGQMIRSVRPITKIKPP